MNPGQHTLDHVTVTWESPLRKTKWDPTSVWFQNYLLISGAYSWWPLSHFPSTPPTWCLNRVQHFCKGREKTKQFIQNPEKTVFQTAEVVNKMRCEGTDYWLILGLLHTPMESWWLITVTTVVLLRANALKAESPENPEATAREERQR